MTMEATAAKIERPNFDVEAIRADFPILSTRVWDDKPLVYLDTGASAQKPRQVIEAMTRVMQEGYANVHRGVHFLSQRATDSYEAAREKVASLLNAPSPETIVFARGGTEAINLVAQSWGRTFTAPGDEIVITALEHHSNIVPWQMLAHEKGLALKVAPIDDAGNLLFDEYVKLLGPRTRLVAMPHISNSLGTILPVAQMIEAAHAVGAVTLVDGCQAVPHMAVDVRALDADFYVFSGHKLYGPTGIGALYGKAELLAQMPPWQGGGEMVDSVTFEETTYREPPLRFEAGTPAIIEAIGLAAAIDYVRAIGFEAIGAHEHDLLEYATERLSTVPGLEIAGQAKDKAAIVSFTMRGAHAHDIGTIIDRAGIAVRAGHHCAQPVMDRLGLVATARASFGLYNTRAEVDALVEALHQVVDIFG